MATLGTQDWVWGIRNCQVTHLLHHVSWCQASHTPAAFLCSSLKPPWPGVIRAAFLKCQASESPGGLEKTQVLQGLGEEMGSCLVGIEFVLQDEKVLEIYCTT